MQNLRFRNLCLGLLLALGIFAAPLHAVPDLSLCGEEVAAHATQGPEYWVGLRQQLEARLREGAPAVDRFKGKTDEVLEVLGELGSGWSGTVWSVRTARGLFALKAFRLENAVEDHVPGILMQEVLGNLGVSPKVERVYDGAQMSQLAKRFPRLNDVKYGLLMQQIGDGANIKEERAPAVTVDWERQTRRLQYFGLVMGYLRISPGDLDMMLSPTGDLFIHDIEYFHWISEKGEDFHAESHGSALPTPNWEALPKTPYGFKPPVDFTWYLGKVRRATAAAASATGR